MEILPGMPDTQHMPFSPDYVRLVLSVNFEDAKTLFLEPLMAIHRAHLVMLAEQRIVAPDVARALRDALDKVNLDAVRRAAYDGTCEDLFYYLDGLVIETCGPDVAGRLHTARSRNDIDMTMYRMRLRECVLALTAATLDLRRVLLHAAERHLTDVFPAHTHTQPAQPTTVAHYMMGLIEQLERDTRRLEAAFETTNRSPLGACAITGTGFPIDRDRTSELLGFSGPTGNTYGSIATVDYLLESAGAASTLLVGVGRFVQDMLLWSTMEVGYLRLSDSLVQTSSIMPQKRNPVALEHARALGSKALAQMSAIPITVHNTPFGDIVDTEDDLQPLVASAFDDASRAIGLVATTMAGAEFDVVRMQRRADEGWVTVTELADVLVRQEGLSFRVAHGLLASLARAPRRASVAETAADLRAAAAAAGHVLALGDDSIAQALSSTHFVAVRETLGGPAPRVTARAIRDSLGRWQQDEAHLGQRRQRLAEAASRLSVVAAAL